MNLRCLVAAAALWTGFACHTPADEIAHFLGAPVFDLHDGMPTERFPNIVVTTQGTVIIAHGNKSVRVRRSLDGGTTWGAEITVVDPGFHGGGLTVDETTGDLLAFVETVHPPAPLAIYKSTDDGVTWHVHNSSLLANRRGEIPSMHMNEHGITLRRGSHAGRLIRPSRWYAGKNERSRWSGHYTNAIYSDDHGSTWQASEPFPAFGTGEAALAELHDGTIYYNSRRHWAEPGENPRRRWTAVSRDGGTTWTELTMCNTLPDGPQDTDYGCMGGLTRLPISGRDILIYTNCDSPAGRTHGTAWVSFDGGATWPLKRLLFEGPFAYSSAAAGRAGTPSEGMIYVHFEGGPQGASTVARLNLSWLLDGTATGDGALPDWIEPPADRSTSDRVARSATPITEPPCSYCSTQHTKQFIRPNDRVVAWLRAVHNGGAFPIRHFLAGPRVVNDTYGLFFYDPSGQYVAAYEKDYGYRFTGYLHGAMTVQGADGTEWSALSGRALSGPQAGRKLKRIPSLVTDWDYWMMLHPESTTYDLFDGKRYRPHQIKDDVDGDVATTRGEIDQRLHPDTLVLGVEYSDSTLAFPLTDLAERACFLVDEHPTTVFWYGPTRTAVAFDRRVDGQLLTFYADAISPESAPFKDKETGTRWTIAGRGIDGPLRGHELNWISGIQCRWYAWSREYPETHIFRSVTDRAGAEKAD